MRSARRIWGVPRPTFADASALFGMACLAVSVGCGGAPPPASSSPALEEDGEVVEASPDDTADLPPLIEPLGEPLPLAPHRVGRFVIPFPVGTVNEDTYQTVPAFVYGPRSRINVAVAGPAGPRFLVFAVEEHPWTSAAQAFYAARHWGPECAGRPLASSRVVVEGRGIVHVADGRDCIVITDGTSVTVLTAYWDVGSDVATLEAMARGLVIEAPAPYASHQLVEGWGLPQGIEIPPGYALDCHNLGALSCHAFSTIDASAPWASVGVTIDGSGGHPDGRRVRLTLPRTRAADDGEALNFAVSLGHGEHLVVALHGDNRTALLPMFGAALR